MARTFNFWLGFGHGSVGRAQPRPLRDPRVDVLRGLALVMIFINHIPANPLAAATLAAWGVADAADLFVLMAGFSAAMAYGIQIDRKGVLAGSLPIGRRVATLYLVQALLFVVVCGLVVAAMHRFDNPLYAEAINIWPVLHDPVNALREAAMLRYQPYYLDILPLYILLLASFPLVYVTARRSPALAMALSLGLWGYVQVTGINLPTAPEHGDWFFNPFAWQLIFTIGIIASLWVRAHGLWRPSLQAFWLAAAIVIAGFVLRSPWSEVWQIAALPPLPESMIITADKTSLAFARVIYALAFVAMLWHVLPSDPLRVETGIWRHLARMGRHSLPIFATGTILSILAHIVNVETGGGLVGNYGSSIVGIVMLCGLGSMLAWRAKILSERQPFPGMAKDVGKDTGKAALAA